jgi:hypothetical protein
VCITLAMLLACSGGASDPDAKEPTDAAPDTGATRADTGPPAVAWRDAGCVPGRPACDGRDNDCDDEVDELGPIAPEPTERFTVTGLSDSSSEPFPSYVQAVPTGHGFCAIAHDEADGELHYLWLASGEAPIMHSETPSARGPRREIMDLAWDGTSCAVLFRTDGELYMRRWQPGSGVWDLGEVSGGAYREQGSSQQMDAALGVDAASSNWVVVHDASGDATAVAHAIALDATSPGVTRIDDFPELHAAEGIAHAAIGPVPLSEGRHGVAVWTEGADPDSLHVLTSSPGGYVDRTGMQLEQTARPSRVELLGLGERVFMLPRYGLYDVQPTLTYGVRGSFNPATPPDRTWYNRHRIAEGPKGAPFLIDWVGDQLLRATPADDVYELTPQDHPAFTRDAGDSSARHELLTARRDGDRLEVLSVEPRRQGADSIFHISEIGCF